MTVFDDVANFADTTVTTPPSPALSGTSLLLAAGNGPMPTPPFNAVAHPAGSAVSFATAEIVRVTAMSGQSVTAMTRAQGGTTAKAIAAGWRFAAATTDKAYADIHGAITALEAAPPGHNHSASAITSGTVAPGRLGSGTASASTVLYGDSAWKVPTSISSRYVDASAAPFGVDFASTADQITPLQAAADAAESAKVPLWLRNGAVRISTSLDLIGVNVEADDARIIMTGTNQPVVKLGGAWQRVRGKLSAEYLTKAAVGHTASVAFLLHDVFMCDYERLRTYYANIGMALLQAEYPPGNGQNTAFSARFATIEVNGWRTSAVRFDSYVGNSTPILVDNLYLHGNPDGSPESVTDVAVLVQDFDGFVANVVNIEQVIFTSSHGVVVNNAAATIRGLHYENVDFQGFGAAAFQAYGRSVGQVEALSMQDVGFVYSGGPQSILSTGGGADGPPITEPTLEVRSIRWLDAMPAPTTPAQFSLHRGDGTRTRVRVTDLDRRWPDATSIINDGASAQSVLELVGTPRSEVLTYAATITPKAYTPTTKLITLTGNITIAAPTSGWTRGAELGFVFTQDATGGRTVTWNGVYKKTWTPTTTANAVNSIRFVYDGTNWVQMAGAVGVT